jgi:hypothetical protein
MPTTRTRTAPAICPPAIPFQLEDFQAIVAGARQMREHGVTVRTANDYPSIPDAVEITWPWSDETRWLAGRCSDGIFLDEFLTQDWHVFGTMLETLTTAMEIMADERAAALATIPGLSGAPLGDLMTNLEVSRPG